MDGTQDGDLAVARRRQEATAQRQLCPHARRRALHLNGLRRLGDQYGGGLLQPQLAHGQVHGAASGAAILQVPGLHGGIIDLCGGAPDALLWPGRARHAGRRLRVGRGGAHKLADMLLMGGEEAMGALRLLQEALEP